MKIQSHNRTNNQGCVGVYLEYMKWKCLNARQWNFVTQHNRSLNLLCVGVCTFDFNSQSHTKTHKNVVGDNIALDSKKVHFTVCKLCFFCVCEKMQNMNKTPVLIVSLVLPSLENQLTYNILVGSRKYFIFKTFHYRNWANNQASRQWHAYTREKGTRYFSRTLI